MYKCKYKCWSKSGFCNLLLFVEIEFQNFLYWNSRNFKYKRLQKWDQSRKYKPLASLQYFSKILSFDNAFALDG